MRIASFNVNSIRIRLPIVLDWLGTHAPDALCLQETKVRDEEFPVEPFQTNGWNVCFHGQKTYNGVAVISRAVPHWRQEGLQDGIDDPEARFLACRFDDLILLNSYVPNGTAPDSPRFEYKLKWFERIRCFLEKRFSPNDKVLWIGDLNVAPTPLDVHDPDRLLGSICYHPDEHAALKKVMDWGFSDVYRTHHPDTREYSFYDYKVPNAIERNIGWRVDHILATHPLSRHATNAWIDLAPRLHERPSDHTVIAADFDI